MRDAELGWVIQLLALSYSALLVDGQQINVDVYKSELFVQKVSPDHMSWNETERFHGFHHVVVSAEGPDLPPWIFTAYVPGPHENNLFLYGVVPMNFDSEMIELLVSFTSLSSYRSKYYKIIISVLSKDEYATHEIRLLIRNVNIDEMLRESRRIEFKEIFENFLWSESIGKLYFTYMAEPKHEGFRLPVNPNDSSGVIVHLGSTVSFSTKLYDLQNETKPLLRHCPSFHKRTTVEKLFRPKGFIVDWCSFRLAHLNDCLFASNLAKNVNKLCVSTSTMTTHSKLPSIPMSNIGDEEELTIKENISTSPVFKTIVTLVVIPALILSIIITCWLICIMCLHNSKLEDPYSDDYFDTVFFVCEDLKRPKMKGDDQSTLDYEEYDRSETLFHF